MFKKSVALILAVAILLAALPISFAANADNSANESEIIGSTLNKVMTKGESLLAYDFTQSTLADGTLPEGFTYGGANTTPALGWGWGADSASVNAKMTTYSGTKYLQFTASNCDGLIAAPAVNTRNYVYEITFIPTISNKYVGISNQTWGTDSLSSSQWFAVEDIRAPYHKYKGTDNAGGTGEFTTTDAYRTTLGEEVTLKVVSYNGANYYFINGRFVTSVGYQGSLGTNETTDRVGLYTYSGNVYIKSMYVNEVIVSGNESEETLPDELKSFDLVLGESLLDVDFTKAELGSELPAGWSVLLGGTGNNAQVGWGNPGTYGAIVESKNSQNMLHFTSSSCDSFLLSPKVDASNYVYEAVILMGGNGYTGLANNVYGSDNTDIKDIQWFCFDDAEEPYWKAYNSGAQSGAKINDGAANDITYTAGREYKLSLYSYNGTNYYYIDGMHIFTAPQIRPNTEEASDRVGFYAYPGDVYVKSVSVKELESTIPEGFGHIGDQYYVLGDVIYENDFDDETAGTLPEGWSYGWPYGTGATKTTYGWAANAQATASAQIVDHATHGKVVQFGSVNTDAFMALPATGTLNYVYEATVVVNTNGNSIGHANNFYGSTDQAHGVMYNSIYPNSTSNLPKYQYRNGTVGADWSPTFSPTNGEELKLKIVSLNGNNYIFYNGVQVAIAPWRIGSDSATSDNPGFYTYNGNMLVKDVKVTAVGTAVLDFDAARVDVNEDNTVDLGFDFSFDKAQAVYDMYVSGDYVPADDFKLGYVLAVGDADVSNDLTVKTEDATEVVFDTDEISQDDAFVYAFETTAINESQFTSLFSVRPFVYVNGIYCYGDGYAYKPANLANGAYESATAQAEKDRIVDVFESYEEFIFGPDTKEITFTVFSDFHYKAGMYSTSIADLQQILKRADDTDSAFIISAGDMCNDIKGSPELFNAYLGYITAEGELLSAYNVYGNHELESGGNTMQVVTPTLTNDVNAHWGDGSVGHDPVDITYGYYYVDYDGFRVICLDNCYDYNPNHYINPDGSMGEVVGWEHYLTASWGGTSAATNATRGFYEGASAAANTKGGSLGDVQMAWLEDVLLDAADNGISCIITGHAGYSGLGFGGGSSDDVAVRALYKKANDANPGTVLMSINGHIHTNNQGWNEGVFYFDVNTVRNNWWQSAGSNHYGPEHTFLYQEYDAQGNPIGDPVEKSLSTLGMASQTWFSEDPLSAVVTINDAGVVTIDGMESKWAYDVVPDAANPDAGVECRISSGTFWNCDTYGHIECCVPDEGTAADRHHIECSAFECGYISSSTAHTFDKQVVSDEYLATHGCINAATYFFSCECGAKGTDTFTYGEALGHKYDNDCDAECNVCREPREVGNHKYTNDADTSCNNCGATAYPGGNTLVNEGGKWYHVVNRAKVADTTLVKYNNVWYYVKNGVVDFSATTLVKYNNVWYYVKAGKMAKDNTLVKFNGVWYHVNGGTITTSTTLVKYNNVWYYVKNGKVDFSATTLVKYSNKWYYVKAGKMAKDNTLVKFNGVWYHVNGGTITTSTTLVKYNNVWYYVQNGKMNNANTLVKYNGAWYHVNGGKWVQDTTLVKYNNVWYYVKGGKVDFTYTGKVLYGGKYYNLVKGKLA